jgi:hypothetical protein
MTIPPEGLAPEPEDSLANEPTASEVEEWAARERQRREAWLSGPTEAEKALWAQRERERRAGEVGPRWLRRARIDPSRTVQRYVRESQLATEGALSLLFKASLSQAIENLVRAGREWEEEFNAAPPRRRRVALESDADEVRVEKPVASASKRIPPPPPPLEGQAGPR